MGKAAVAMMRPLSIVRGIGALTVAAMLCFASQSVAQTDKQAPPDWIADSMTGCKIWNPAPEPHESAHWAGPCKDGFAEGKGTLQWTENGQLGDRYDGEYQHGKRNGHGVITDSEGHRIEGNWLNDELLQPGANEIDFSVRR
jgi:hypothetical protein